jgi:Predicted acyltransferase
MTFVPCAVIPSRNHYLALPEVVSGVAALGLPVFIIDDGSDPQAAEAIAALHDPQRGVHVHRLPQNRGKGVAVVEGFGIARRAGFTHALQVDADGQHDLAALPRLLEKAEAHPQALVSGAPVYDESIPKARKIGRWATHLWVFVETLSLRITDSMCGLRVYPLAACLELLQAEPVGARMDFDTDIMVRLFWRGVPPVMVPVRVTYPPGNISNFDVLRDNLRITRMHTRLVLTMLLRLPRILRNRPPVPCSAPETGHWAGLAERGAYWGLRLVAGVYRLLGRKACMAVVAPVVLYFHITGTRQRQASRHYLGRALGRQPSWLETYLHALDFGRRALDTLAAWAGAVPPRALESDGLDTLSADPRGGVIVVSHHGNVELARALMPAALRDRLTVLVHTRHAENYNRVLRELRPEAATRMIQVTEIGPETAIALQGRVERGEWIAIAGDRVPVLSQGRVVRVPFLGRDAEFSQGPWLLAAVLDCPVRLLFCWREGQERWRMTVEDFAERVVLPRGRREQAVAGLAGRYAARLERECCREPRQWYNFFDFWDGETR